MAKRQSIYIPEQAQEILKAFGENSTSGAIATLLYRYDKITREYTPELTESEWMAICDVLNGCGALLSSGGYDQAPMIWAEIMDSEQDGLGEKWGISCKDLAEKLRSLPSAGRCAAWDVAAHFWASPELNDVNAKDLLVESGAKIKE